MPIPEDKRNTAGFDKNPENINRKGQPKKVSIKRELEKLLLSDGTIKYKGSQIVDMGTNADGERWVKIKMPKMEALANKIVSIAMGPNAQSNTLRAAIQLLEQFDGKPTQALDASIKQEQPITIVSSQEVKDAIDDL